MGPAILSALFALGADPAATPPGSFVCQPWMAVDAVLRGPSEPYQPQPGDIFFATDQALWARVGHRIAGTKGVHHSGLFFARPDGSMALLEAGPFNSLKVEVMDPFAHMNRHVAAGDCVWVRRRRVPLTPDQCGRLTAFAAAQEGKPFAWVRLLAQVTPFRPRGQLRIHFVGKPHGERDRYFCAELVMECLVAAGLVDPVTARPSCTYPLDLFTDHSGNHFIDRTLKLAPDWEPTTRWTPVPVP